MTRVKSRAPASFAPHVNDMEKRLNLLFDHLNNEDLLKPDTVQLMVEISRCVQNREMDRAADLVTDMIKEKLDTQGGNWMVSLSSSSQQRSRD